MQNIFKKEVTTRLRASKSVFERYKRRNVISVTTELVKIN